MLLYGILLGVIGGGSIGYFMARFAYGDAGTHSIAEVDCEVEIHDWGKDYDPKNMRWRYIVRQAGVPVLDENVLTLGNAASKHAAKAEAQAWIDQRRAEVSSEILVHMRKVAI